MFRIFQKRRIERYAQEASRYVNRTYEAPVPQKTAHIRYKLHVPDTGNNRVKHSLRYDGRVPSQDDKFQADTVDQLFALSLPNVVLNKELDAVLNLTFAEMLVRYIDLQGLRDTHVYKAAQIDRRLFSKIVSDRNYKPSKDTALALAIALKLTVKQVNDLLSRAGYTLSHSNKRDVIIEYLIREGVYDLNDINEVLHKLDQKYIGR